MRIMPLIWFMVQLLLGGIVQINGLAKFTNVQCVSQDSNITTFTACRLYAVKRDVAEMSLRIKILQILKKPISMRIQLLKRASGYKPFLYDVRHTDLCEYLHRRNNPFVNIVFNSFANHTNVNKCPLPDELSVEHFRFPVKALERIPLPSGEYAIYATFSYNHVEQVLLKVFFSITEFR